LNHQKNNFIGSHYNNKRMNGFATNNNDLVRIEKF